MKRWGQLREDYLDVLIIAVKAIDGVWEMLGLCTKSRGWKDRRTDSAVLSLFLSLSVSRSLSLSFDVWFNLKYEVLTLAFLCWTQLVRPVGDASHSTGRWGFRDMQGDTLTLSNHIFCWRFGRPGCMANKKWPFRPRRLHWYQCFPKTHIITGGKKSALNLV